MAWPYKSWWYNCNAACYATTHFPANNLTLYYSTIFIHKSPYFLTLTYFNLEDHINSSQYIPLIYVQVIICFANESSCIVFIQELNLVRPCCWIYFWLLSSEARLFQTYKLHLWMQPHPFVLSLRHHVGNDQNFIVVFLCFHLRLWGLFQHLHLHLYINYPTSSVSLRLVILCNKVSFPSLFFFFFSVSVSSPTLNQNFQTSIIIVHWLWIIEKLKLGQWEHSNQKNILRQLEIINLKYCDQMWHNLGCQRE